VGLLRPESLRFKFITQPMKRHLSLRIVSEPAVIVESVAELCLATAFEPGASCLFHLWLGHAAGAQTDSAPPACNHSPKFYLLSWKYSPIVAIQAGLV
jgi:hypothetical protein